MSLKNPTSIYRFNPFTLFARYRFSRVIILMCTTEFLAIRILSQMMLFSPLWDSHTTRRACSSNHSRTLGGFWPDWRRRAVAAYVRQWNCDRSSQQRSVKKMWSACIGFLIVIRERFVYCPFHISNLGGKPGCGVRLSLKFIGVILYDHFWSWWIYLPSWTTERAVHEVWLLAR